MVPDALFTPCAGSSVLWIQWTTVVILGIMLLVDLMFLDDSAFVFDPDPATGAPDGEGFADYEGPPG